MQTYRIIADKDRLGRVPYPVGTIVKGYPYLNWIGIKVDYSMEYEFYDKSCFEEV